MVNNHISHDKHLWIYILHQKVISKGLCIPSNLQSIEDVSTQDIESWVKHAILLDRKYNTPDCKLYIRDLNNNRSVTWVKLIRGSWCLAASSDKESSSILLWSLTDNNPDPVAEYHLPGPVIDGIVEDSREYIRFAITVGTRSVYSIISIDSN